MFFKKKEKIKVEIETINFECLIDNAEQKDLKKIFNTEFSIVDIYIREYNNGTGIKVLLLENDKIIGDVPSDKIVELLNFKVRTGEIYVDNYLNDNGELVYRGTLMFKKTITKDK